MLHLAHIRELLQQQGKRGGRSRLNEAGEGGGRLKDDYRICIVQAGGVGAWQIEAEGSSMVRGV